MESVSWKAPEYIHTHKTADWYWVVGIVTVSIALIAIILNNVIFAILIIVSSITLTLYASRLPQTITVELSGTEVRVGQSRYPYADLESYWVESREAYPKVFFKPKKRAVLYITALIEGTDPTEVDEFLSSHLPKEEYTEPLLEKVLLYLGF